MIRYPGIGHNQGPPLDPETRWRVHSWRKAQEKAWCNPPIELVRRRSRRARELGLSYRAYTAVLLDRGAHLETVVFDLGGTLVRIANDEVALDAAGQVELLPGVAQRLSQLANCKVFVVTNQAGVAEGLMSEAQAHELIAQVNARVGGRIDDYRICMDAKDSGSAFRKPRPGMVLDLLRSHGLSPHGAFLVGDNESDRGCAAAAGLAAFIWAADYFDWR